MEQQVKVLQTQVKEAIAKANNLEQLQDLHQKYFSRKGELSQLMSGLKNLSSAEKPKMGALINTTKVELEALFQKKQAELSLAAMNAELEKEWVDITAPGAKWQRGHIHPISQVQREVEDIFSSMGFEIKDGPEVESEYFNFDGLNIPASHPARDMQDTFFIEQPAHPDFGRLVLRTHTSPVQVRTMQAEGAPIRIIVPGRTFRNEAIDATHDATFYQVEGLLVDKNMSLAHLKGTMEEFLSRFFEREITVRFRPGYFPFVEPGLELDMLWEKGENGKPDKWLEFMGCGMVHSNVLRAGGIDPDEYQGWAFGFGLTRLVMMRYRIPDHRFLFSGDLRFLSQF